jgi:hypothetical protein
MANKIIAIIIGLLILTTMPLVLAEENSEIVVDSNITPLDERETKLILLPLGAEIRMTQLEKSITRNVLIGETILETLKTNHTDYDLTESEKTLNTLEMVLEEVKNTNLEGDKNELVQIFVELKKEARTLCAQFKTQTNPLINQNDRDEIMTKIKTIDSEYLMNITNKVREKVREHNALRTRQHLERMGDLDETLIKEIQEGKANLTQTREKLMKKFGGLTDTNKKQIATQTRNETIQNITKNKKIMDQIKPKLEQKIMNKIQTRMCDMNTGVQQKETQIQNRMNRIRDAINNPKIINKNKNMQTQNIGGNNQ